MALNFPANPSPGDRFTAEGASFVWTGVVWAATSIPSDALLRSENPTLVGLEALDLEEGDILYAVGPNMLQKLARSAVNTILRLNDARLPEWIDAGVLLGAALPGVPLSGVGAFAFATHGNPATAVAYGATVAGSSLRPTGAMYRGNFATGTTQVVATLGAALAGTWQCLGVSSTVTQAGTATISNATLWRRIA